ncbi:uncharacterized protein LOC129940975 [Eupeodes corollae]|uniref:uncharacterized protein LOC129940975 n=1 Tax=Eupeodes corollae TaxID=290404 RepID=UPI0024933658|nr:uncharacterized protein LOC129940975 [Eupeodes corollae]
MAAISKNGLNLTLASSLIGIVLLFNFASAQIIISSTTTTLKPPSQLQSCQEATPKNVNLTLFHGEWFEAARKIQNSTNNESCNAWNFENDTNPVTFTSTYNTNPNKLWANESTAVQINVTDGVYSLNNTDGSVNIYKILETDYDTFAFICSYKNSSTNEAETSTTTASTTEQSTTTSSSSSSSSSTSESTTSNPSSTSSPIPETTPTPSTLANTASNAYVLVRHRSLNSTELANLTALAGSQYSDFKNLTTVIQSEKCTSGSSALMPMVTMILAVILATFYKS